MTKKINTTTLLAQILGNGDQQQALQDLQALIAAAGINDGDGNSATSANNLASGLLGSQDANDAERKQQLLSSLLKLEELTQQQAAQTKKSNTQPAKAKASDQLDGDIQRAVSRLQGVLGARTNTRNAAYKATQTNLGLDVTDKGQGGELANSILHNQANILDSINNGSAAAQRLATEKPFSKGGWYRAIFGNTYAEGVSDAKDRLADLSSSFETVKTSARTSFKDALLKDTPLAEATTRFNSDVKGATSSAARAEANLLIAPTQAAVDSIATGIEINQAKTADTLQAQTAAVDSIATARNIAGIDKSITRKNNSLATISAGLNIVKAGNTQVYTNPDGSFFSPATTPEEKANSATILGNQAATSIRNRQVREGAASVTEEIANAQFKTNAGKSQVLSVLPVDSLGNIDETKLSKQQKLKFDNTVKDAVVQDTATITAEAALVSSGAIHPNPEFRKPADKARLKTETTKVANRIASDKVRIATTAGRLARDAADIKTRLENPKDLTASEQAILRTQLTELNKQLAGALDEEYQLTIIGNPASSNRLESLRGKLQRKELTRQAYEAAVIKEKGLHIEDSLFKARTSDNQTVKAISLKNAEIQRVIAETDLDLYISRNTLVTSKKYQDATHEQQVAMLLIEDNKAQAKRASTLELAIELDGGINDKSVIEEGAIKEAELKLARLKNGQLQAAELAAKTSTLAAQKAIADNQVDTIAKNKALTEKRKADYYVITGEQADDITVNNPDISKRLDSVLPDGRLADNPYSAIESYNAFTPNKTALQRRVGFELANMKSDIIGNRTKVSATDINIGIQRFMNPDPTKVTNFSNIDSTKPSNSLLDLPSRDLVLESLPANSPYRSVVESVSNWDELSPLDRLRGVKQYYVDNISDGNTDVSLLAKLVSNTMSEIMTAKARAGDYALLGIPEPTSLRYNVKVSSLINSESSTLFYLGKTLENSPINISPEETIPVDVMSPAGISLLIKNGKL